MWLQWRRIEKRIRAKDDLYDVSMLRGYGCKNDGYGELLPNFSKQLAEVLQLTASHKVLDVGSGIGFLCFDLACLSGCNVKGIEIRRDIYLKSVQIAKHVAQRMRLEVQFVYGDATGDSFHFNNMDVIVCCNTLWSDENNYRYPLFYVLPPFYFVHAFPLYYPFHLQESFKSSTSSSHSYYLVFSFPSSLRAPFSVSLQPTLPFFPNFYILSRLTFKPGCCRSYACKCGQGLEWWCLNS